jgi:hemoglobin
VTIYDQIGGQPVIKTATTVFYGRVTEDAALARWFADIDISRLRAHQRAFLAAALDGPQLFTGLDLGEAHSGREITDDAYTRVVAHLITTLDDLGVEERILTEVELRLETLRRQVVSA